MYNLTELQTVASSEVKEEEVCCLILAQPVPGVKDCRAGYQLKAGVKMSREKDGSTPNIFLCASPILRSWNGLPTIRPLGTGRPVSEHL